MKILIDTNVLISAALNLDGTPYKAYVKAVSYPNSGMICEQNIDELRRIFNRKFPSKLVALEEFIALAFPALEIVPTPETEAENEGKIRDVRTCLHKTGVRICGKILSMARQKSAGILAYFKDF